MTLLQEDRIHCEGSEYLRWRVAINGEGLYFAEACHMHGDEWARKRIEMKINQYKEKHNGEKYVEGV